MDWIFAGITAVVAMYALGNWRMGLYICILLDVARDPVRKLSEHQSSLITIIVGGVWMTAIISASQQNRREVSLLYRRYPQMRSSVFTLIAGLVPGALISMMYYSSGWMLAAIGLISYTTPMIGVLLGYLWSRRLKDVYLWMTVYSLVNSVVLIGSILEAFESNFPGLGGMKMIWIRNHGADIIKLVSGFYRSPDVMGLHAAHVIMFSLLLAARPRGRFAWFWVAIAGWAGVSLILCGRRKMIVIPMICFATYIGLVAIYAGKKRLAVFMVCVAGLMAAGASFAMEGMASESEYTRFASSIASEGVERVSLSFSDSIVVTIRQSGWLGGGLGTVTQGRQYMGVKTDGKDWQEDGVGRLFRELGLPGVVCMIAAAAFLFGAIRSSLDSVPNGHPVGRLQFGFCGIAAANIASFTVSHQAYSGDPSTILILGFCIGLILGMPRTVWGTTQAPRQETMEELPQFSKSERSST